MTKFGIKYEQGDIVIVPFPFTDLTTFKQRPVLIISNDDYNKITEDVVVCGITSNPEKTDYSTIIDNDSFLDGKIPVVGRIKADKLFTLKQTLIKKKIAKLKPAAFENVKKELQRLISL